MPLPTLTHLQFLVVRELLEGELPGREIRDRIASAGAKKSGPAFYQMMARLEDGQFVKGHYTEKVIDGQMIRERCYRLLANGVKAYERSCEFYSQEGFGLQGGLGYANR